MMTLNEASELLRGYIEGEVSLRPKRLAAIKESIDAHLAQQPDLAAIREVIADMRMAKSPYCQAWADKLTAALQENAK